MVIDMSFKNEMILGYFNGDDSYLPVSELIYLHEHPLIKESFLVEMEVMIHKTSAVMAKKNMQGSVVNRFIDATIALGTALPTVDKLTAPNILQQLRTIYVLCKAVLTG